MVPSGAKWGLEMRGNEHRCKSAVNGRAHARPAAGGNARAGPLNEVVCGAMMLAYERSGKWNEVCGQAVTQAAHPYYHLLFAMAH